MNQSPGQAIEVAVETSYLESDSKPADGRFVFAYTITITNGSDEAAQLLNRHWIIADGNGDEQEVRGAGVVGQQPRIPPGQSFRYTSGAVLETEVGSMRGSYEFQADDGRLFDVPIPTFGLFRPNALH
ncbi:MAG: Co2+/Mg2+ efflux protein ApaG [Pseudomonadota bacterium]